MFGLPAILTARLTRNDYYRSQEFLRQEGDSENLKEEAEDSFDVEVVGTGSKNAANDQKPNIRTF